MSGNIKNIWELGLFAPSVSQLTVSDTLSLIEKSAYKSVEWRVQTREAIEGSPWGKAYNTLSLDMLKEETAAFIPLLKKQNISVSALQIDAPKDFPRLEVTVLDAAQAMGCKHVLITSPHYDPKIGYRVLRDDFRKTISGWVKHAKGTGIRICVENHFWSITPSTALIVDLLQDFNPVDVGVMWDPANSFWEGLEVPSMALDLLGTYLAEVHFKNGCWGKKDGAWAFDWCDIPDGLVDWVSVLNLIKQAGYQGPLVVEDYRPATPQEKLAKARHGLDWAINAVK